MSAQGYEDSKCTVGGWLKGQRRGFPSLKEGQDLFVIVG
jgi:hypothetical protein